ncbi:MAG TPA: autotransporter domain-containing protein [Chthoniobacteraceae bacterium]|nr:autotransporter domain-containing protein [Chthoniobacteraceae bacterium]
MRQSKVGNPFAKSCAIALAAAAVFGGILIATSARADILLPSGWINTGSDGAGGSNFVGSGTVGALGPSTDPALSINGGDIITLQSGGFAIGAAGQSTITITTSNDKLLNFGTIMGANAVSNGAAGAEAVEISAATISNDSLINHGAITGGNGHVGSSSRGGAGGDAIHVSATNITGGSLQNFGSITGGNGGSASSGHPSGRGGFGVSIDATNINNSSLLYNAPGATITGGAGGRAVGSNDHGGNGGDAFHVNADTATNDSATNAGVIMGGAGGAGGINGHGGDGGDGIDIDPVVAVPGATDVFFNSGTIMGGQPGASGIGSGTAGAGMYALGSNISVVNSGLIEGGSGGVGLVENAIVKAIVSGGSSGGDQPAGVLNNASGIGGVGLWLQGNNESVLNLGTITGGNGVAAAVPVIEAFGGGAAGVFVDGNNSVVVNYGTINGGNGLGLNNVRSTPGGFLNEGTGVLVLGGSDTVVNAGVINGGQGEIALAGVVKNTGPATQQGAAILMQGSDNTVILTGHSTTNGMIVATGSTNTNKLVLNFSGVSPLEQAIIKQELQSMGALSGTQSSGSFNFRGTTIKWDPLVIVLKLTSYQAQALTPNQAAVGANLDSFVVNPTGDMLSLLNTLDASGNIPGGLEALSPQRYQIYGDIALSSANFSSLQIDQRLNNLRVGSESIDTTGVGGDTAFTGGEQDIAGWTKGDDGKDQKKVVQVEPQEKRWGFFASGDALFENFDGDKDLASSKFTTSGLVLGLDGRINEHFVVGTLFDYQYTSATMDNLGSKANVASYGGGLYGGYHDGGWYANGLLMDSENSYDSSRAVVILPIVRAAQATTHGNQFETNLDGGYDFTLAPDWVAGPIAGMQYTHLGISNFTESGAGAADLAVNPADLDSLRSRLGAHLVYRKQLCKEVSFAAETRAEWQHEFLDDSRAISADFIGSGLGGFAVQTSAPQRDAALVGIGANFTIRDRMTVFTDYDVQAGQSSYFEQSVRAGLKFSW